jgi:hypothetical protein
MSACFDVSRTVATLTATLHRLQWAPCICTIRIKRPTPLTRAMSVACVSDGDSGSARPKSATLAVSRRPLAAPGQASAAPPLLLPPPLPLVSLLPVSITLPALRSPGFCYWEDARSDL